MANNIDPVTINHLTDALRALKRRLERSDALSYLKFRHELEKEQQEFGKDNSQYLAALDYIVNTNGDMPLIDVINAFNKASTNTKKR